MRVSEPWAQGEDECRASEGVQGAAEGVNTRIADWAAQEIARIRATRDKPLTAEEMRDFPAKLERDRLRYMRALQAKEA